MSQSFIEFFEKLQERPDAIQASEGREDAPNGATVIGDVEENVDGQETIHRLVDFTSSESESDIGDEEEQPRIDWDEVKQSTRLGPLLSSLREEQEKQPMSQRETYSVEHLKRLYQFIPKHPYSKPRANKLCSKVHPKPCPYQCKSCHFCRQRTTEQKTVCSVCDGVNNYYGGPARGFWCGSCLWLRIGENIDEVRKRTDWVCPACRDICNCSGANCMRIKRGWFPTNQLSHEARDQGYKSVAHYLVLTHLSEQASAAPMELMLGGPTRRRRKQPSVIDLVPDSVEEEAEEEDIRMDSPPTRTRRHAVQKTLPLQFVGRRTRKEALEMASKPRVQREITDILKDLGSSDCISILDRIVRQADGLETSNGDNHVVPTRASKFLCILDQDMKDEDEDDQDKTSTVSLPQNFDAIRKTMYSDGGAQHVVHKVVVRGVQTGKRGISSVKVGDQMLPPKKPSDFPRNVRRRTPASTRQQTVGHAETSCDEIPDEEENINSNANIGADIPCDDDRETQTQPYNPHSDEQKTIVRPPGRTQIPLDTLTGAHQANGIAIDEFIWNGLCLRALSIVDAVKTFYFFHPDVSGSNSNHLVDGVSDRALYENIYETTRSNLQKVLKSAEALATEDASIQYTSKNVPESVAYPGTLRTVGGVRRAVQLLTYLSRILPEADIRWRIEKRLLGLEPFADFQTSSPHAKAVILRGRLELVAILQKRRMCSPMALENLGDTLGAIAVDMKAALPLLDSIIENQPMPMQNFTISGWSYNEETRERRIVDIFTDLSVLYASLHEVLLLGIQRTTETCAYIGAKSYQILTDSLMNTLLDVENLFPGSIVKEGFGLVCTVIDLAFVMFEDQNIDMTVGERNVFLLDRNGLIDFMEQRMIPRLETLVQKDYCMWGKTRQLSNTTTTTTNLFKHRADSLGSEKVEVLARCYALLLRAGRANWAALESKATEPYSFSQYWKYANLRYRRFSLYLLSHTLEKAPSVLQHEMNLPSILRMWLLSVLDFGRHECSWYLTSIIAENTKGILTNIDRDSLDFRTDATGKKSKDILRQFAENLMKGQLKSNIAGIVLLLDECLQERQREIIQTSFNVNKSLLKWQRYTARSLLGLLEPLATIMCSATLAGKELRKLLRRCAIWTVESFWMIKQQSSGENINDMNQVGVEIDVEMLSNQGDIRQELDESVCGDLSLLASLIDLLRLRSSSQDDIAAEYMEPLSILILGVSELGDGGISLTPFEAVMYDKVAAALFEAKPLLLDTNSEESSNLLHHHVLGVHLRRLLLKTGFRHQHSERLGVNAMRFAHAIFARPEMRSPMTFKAAFDLMMTTWISLLSQVGDLDSLAVRYEFLQLIMLSVNLHPGMMPGCIVPTTSFGHVYHLFWKVVCSDFLRLLSKRFPEALSPAISMEAEYIYCHILPTYSGIELYTPSTPAMLSEAYNHALGEFGRPPSWEILDSIHSSITLGDVLPRVFGVRQSQVLGNFRPGDFGWTVGKLFLLLLNTMAKCNCEEASGLAGYQSPGIWYCLCCVPYLESIVRKGERASLLIEKEYLAFMDSLENQLGTLRRMLAHRDQSHIRSVATTVAVQTIPVNPESKLIAIQKIDDVHHLDLGTIFSIASYLVKVRKIEREGMKVAVCSLCDDPSSLKEFFNVLISKPQELVELLLDSNMPLTLPRKVDIGGIEFVRKKLGNQVAVARSTSTCTVNLSSNQDISSRDATHSQYVEASRRLQTMGYGTSVVMHCIKQLQRETQGGPPLSIAAIVSRAVERMNNH